LVHESALTEYAKMPNVKSWRRHSQAALMLESPWKMQTVVARRLDVGKVPSRLRLQAAFAKLGYQCSLNPAD
jgi:hypothetical protein